MSISKEKHDELCVAYAALILHDGEAEINGEQINKVITASGNEVEPYWPMLFASALQKKDIVEIIAKPTAAAPAAAGAAAGGEAAPAAAAEEEEEEEEEEVEVDLGGGDMFGGDDY